MAKKKNADSISVLYLVNKSKGVFDEEHRVRICTIWWTQRDSNPRPLGCEPNALPAELWAHIAAFLQGFRNKKQIFKSFDFRRFRRKFSPKLWAETRRSMSDHRDANRTLSQLSYKPVTYLIIIHISPQNARGFSQLLISISSVLLMININVSYFTYTKCVLY